ncbi:MAG TPA: hypothetical protein VEW04_11150 [Allosphingosinicella sp.]|nr:hypothetical protein [Allosphingosinicella sp.]
MILRAPLLLILFLAAAPLVAQKPTADETDPIRARYRDRALAVCVVDLAAAERFTADTRESVCGCAVGRFMPRWPTGALPMLEGARVPPMMGSDLIACAGEEDPALAAAVARRLAQAPAPPSPVVAAPIDKPQAAPDEEPRFAPRPERSSWFEGLSLPRWLTDVDLPLWVLAPLALFVFLFLRGLMRRSEEKDLLGPPRSMQITASPPRPRRP